MKAFVLAAGLGTRLRPITDYLPKPLVPIMNQPLLAVALRQLAEAGFDSFAVNAHHLADQVQRFASQWREAKNPIFTSIENPELLGTGGALVPIREWLGGESFAVYNGDILSNISFHALKAAHESSNNLVTLAVRPGHTGNDGVVWGKPTASGLEVLDIGRTKPLVPGIEPFTFGCAYLCRNAIHDFVPQEGSSSIIDAMVAGLKAGHRIQALVHNGFWADIGNPQSLWSTTKVLLGWTPQELQKLFLTPVHKVDATAKIHGTAKLHDDVVVGANAQIHANAVIESSLLLPGTVIAAGEVVKHKICGPSGMAISL